MKEGRGVIAFTVTFYYHYFLFLMLYNQPDKIISPMSLHHTHR